MSLDGVLVRPGRGVRVVMLTLHGMSAVVIVSWLVTAIVHVDGRYAIHHVSGTWMALAAYVNAGTP